MIYNYTKQIIAMFFLISIVNLLVIPDAYKKIISFYLHFFIIVIILKPILNIMGNEVSSIFDSVTYITEDKFNLSVEYYQGRLGDDLKEFTLEDIDQTIRAAENVCEVQINFYELDEKLTINSRAIKKEDKMCIASELGISISDINFEGGGQ